MRYQERANDNNDIIYVFVSIGVYNLHGIVDCEFLSESVGCYYDTGSMSDLPARSCEMISDGNPEQNDFSKSLISFSVANQCHRHLR